MSGNLLTDVHAGVATITFARPEVRNAISREMILELTDIVRGFGADDAVRCLVFRGAGEHFSGGGDVGGFKASLERAPEARRQEYEQRVSASAEVFGLLDELRKPVVSVARGAVAGAGLSFIMTSDLAIASDTAFCVFAHCKLGIALDSALSYLLPRTVGLRKARELAITGARLSASEALELGIFTRVVPDAELDAVADEQIARLASGATKAIGATRALLRQALTNDARSQVRLEAEAVGACAATHDFVEGVSSFLAGRKSQFEGR